MRRRLSIAPVLSAPLLALIVATPAGAIDAWERGANGDDGPSYNSIGHGETQVHDLEEQGANDQDWVAVPTLSGHSYEARISGSTFPFDRGNCSTCPQFERVNDTGGLLTEDQAVVNEGAALESYERTIRWMAGTNTTRQYVRVTGHVTTPEDAGHVYSLRFWDTTYTVPRWSAANGQSTVFQVVNVGQLPAYVMLNLTSSTGADLFSVVRLVARNLTWVVDTSQYPQLGGLSGFAQISHTAGYGGLAGKAIILEPATGIAFETPLLPIPY